MGSWCCWVSLLLLHAAIQRDAPVATATRSLHGKEHTSPRFPLHATVGRGHVRKHDTPLTSAAKHFWTRNRLKVPSHTFNTQTGTHRGRGWADSKHRSRVVVSPVFVGALVRGDSVVLFQCGHELRCARFCNGR